VTGPRHCPGFLNCRVIVGEFLSIDVASAGIMAAVRAATLVSAAPETSIQNYLPVPFRAALPSTVCEPRHGCSRTEAGARSASHPTVA